MKLRNKKTGETINGGFVVCEYKDGARFSVKDKPCFDSLDELKEEWEDYKPAEPYIKDKKVRRFVRDWAEHWKIDKVIIRFIDSNRIDLIGFPSPSSTKTGREIDIQRTVVRNEIIYGNRYTITELCGEEK